MHFSINQLSWGNENVVLIFYMHFSFWAHYCLESIFQKDKSKYYRFTLQNYHCKRFQTASINPMTKVITLSFFYIFHIQITYKFSYFPLTLLSDCLEALWILKLATGAILQLTIASSSWQKQQSLALFSIVD